MVKKYKYNWWSKIVGTKFHALTTIERNTRFSKFLFYFVAQSV
jgi:hypothetical protein